ncbi:MAG TPA: hydroxymethylbilane synthase [Ktedonobacteraceae bacterium]|nr:hydroxymethylbilane synthase [Ktedonobacteraceae bacterium]
MLQTHSIIARLHQQWPDLDIQIEQIRTLGDHNTTLPLSAIGGDGVFVMEIERALLEGRIDLAVHSLKDLPTAQTSGLHTCVVGAREDARDVLVWNEKYASFGDRLEEKWVEKHEGDRKGPHLTPPHSRLYYEAEDGSIGPFIVEAGADVEKGAGTLDPCGRLPTPKVSGRARPGSPDNNVTSQLRIGTCSLRRTAQLRALLPDIDILLLRGNVDTRLRKLDAGEYNGIVLAAAGLHRLGAHERVAHRMTYLPFEVMLPAPGQGALALEMRDEEAMRELVAPLNDSATQATTSAERMFMRRLGAGCYLPIAAYSEIQHDRLALQGLVISLDGKEQVRVRSSIPWSAQSSVERAAQLGVQLAEQALEQGAAAIIQTVNEGRVREHA